jgi:branched-chain amino acid transport system ATP-binding protein
MLHITNLLVFYENALAVNNVTLEVREGEIVGLVGPNGAGKSSLLHAVCGVLADRAVKAERAGGERITVLGEIRHLGADLMSLRPAERVARGVVLCPERRRVFAESSVEENLRIGAYRAPRPEWRRTLDAVWELFPRLHAVRRRRAGFLSGGEQQMLALGRALMARPRLFLVDEPLLGLAPSVQLAVIEAVRAIAERGVTILVAEQYARPVLPLVARGYVLEGGAVTASGTGVELMANPHVRGAYLGA